MKMYPDVHFLRGELVTVGAGYHEGPLSATKAHLLLLEPSPWRRSSITRGRPCSGVQTFTNFSQSKSTTRKLPRDLACIGFPNKPKSNKKLDELKGESLLAWWKHRSRNSSLNSPKELGFGLGIERLQKMASSIMEGEKLRSRSFSLCVGTPSRKKG
jgi:hypothetical protein